MSDAETKPKQPTISELNKYLRIKFDASALTLLAPFMANNDIRYYLQGIQIEPAIDKPLGGLYLIATDGYRLSVVYDPNGTISGNDGRSVIMKVTPEMVRISGKRSPLSRNVLMRGPRVSLGRDFGMEHTDFEDYVMPGRPWIDGKFPDWRRVLPVFSKLQPGLVQEVNVRYLAEYAKIGRDRNSPVKFWHASTTGCAVVQLAALPQFLSIIMPMHSRGEAQWIEAMKPIMSAKPVEPETAAANDAEPVEKAA